MMDGDQAASPGDRSNTTAATIQNRTENRFEKQNKALMRRGSPYFEYAVTVVDLTYNEDRKGWDYQVKDDGTGILWTSWVAERDLKRA